MRCTTLQRRWVFFLYSYVLDSVLLCSTLFRSLQRRSVLFLPWRISLYGCVADSLSVQRACCYLHFPTMLYYTNVRASPQSTEEWRSPELDVLWTHSAGWALVQQSTALCYTMLYHSILHYTIVHYTILRCSIVYYAILYCSFQNCTSLLHYSTLPLHNIHNTVHW